MNVKIKNRVVGEGYPVYIIAEIGINHNGDLKIAKRLIDAAVEAGCDAIKFQKRVPELCIPEYQKNTPRETPWGIMNYIEYRKRIEFGIEEYQEIDRYCKDKDIHWFASCWDVPSVKFMEKFNPPCYKIASASTTDVKLLKAVRDKGRPVILSTGMSTMEQIRDMVGLFDKRHLLLAHSTSIYPCPIEKLNLRMIPLLKQEFQAVTGYSGHEVGLSPTYAAVVLGAAFVERHITLDRSMWGSDQAASVEIAGLKRLVENIKDIETALGDGIKQNYAEELITMKRLRKMNHN